MKYCSQCQTEYDDTTKFCRHDGTLTKFRLSGYRLTKTVHFLLVLGLIPGLSLAGPPPITTRGLFSESPPPPKERPPATKEAFLAKLKQGIEGLRDINRYGPPITMIYQKEDHGVLLNRTPGLPTSEFAVDREALEAFKQGYVVSAKCLKTLVVERTGYSTEENFPSSVVRLLWEIYVYDNDDETKSARKDEALEKEEESRVSAYRAWLKKELESAKKSCDPESFAQVARFVDDVSTTVNDAIETVKARIARNQPAEGQIVTINHDEMRKVKNPEGVRNLDAFFDFNQPCTIKAPGTLEFIRKIEMAEQVLVNGTPTKLPGVLLRYTSPNDGKDSERTGLQCPTGTVITESLSFWTDRIKEAASDKERIRRGKEAEDQEKNNIRRMLEGIK